MAIRLARMATNVLLARLLAPRVFGVFAVGAIAIDTLLTLNDLGITVGIVRARGNVRVAARTGVTIAFVFSVLLYGVCFLAAPWFASALNAPDATNVLRLMTVAVLLDGICAVPSGLLSRALRTDLLAVAQLSGFVLGTSLTIGMAVAGFGVWSLAWGRVIGTAVTVVAYVALAPYRPRPGFDLEEARKLLRFGLPLAGLALLQFALLNADYLVVGRLMGPLALGFYLLAFNVSSWPESLVSVAVRTVTVAGFSRLVGDSEELASGFVRTFGLLMTAAIPASLLLICLASPLVGFVYGRRWLPSVGALQFLVVFAGMRIAMFFVTDLLTAVGRLKMAVWMQVAWLVPLIPALAIGARLAGLTGVGAAHAVVAIAVGAPAIVYGVHRLGFSPTRMLSALVWPVAAAVPATIACLVSASLVTNDFARIGAGASAGLLAFALFAGIPIMKARLWARR
jgi:PST family polysaccharide transporter